ncbi:hypothetical protein PENANT_c348G09800, partial [Penicillium antarcticum]
TSFDLLDEFLIISCVPVSSLLLYGNGCNNIKHSPDREMVGCMFDVISSLAMDQPVDK